LSSPLTEFARARPFPFPGASGESLAVDWWNGDKLFEVGIGFFFASLLSPADETYKFLEQMVRPSLLHLRDGLGCRVYKTPVTLDPNPPGFPSRLLATGPLPPPFSLSDFQYRVRTVGCFFVLTNRRYSGTVFPPLSSEVFCRCTFPCVFARYFGPISPLPGLSVASWL